MESPAENISAGTDSGAGSKEQSSKKDRRHSISKRSTKGSSRSSFADVEIITINDDDTDDVIILEPSNAHSNRGNGAFIIKNLVYLATSMTENQTEEPLASDQSGDAATSIRCAWCGVKCLEGFVAHFAKTEKCRNKSVKVEEWMKRTLKCKKCGESLQGLKAHHDHYSANRKCHNHWLQLLSKITWEAQRRCHLLDDSVQVSAAGTSTTHAIGMSTVTFTTSAVPVNAVTAVEGLVAVTDAGTSAASPVTLLTPPTSPDVGVSTAATRIIAARALPDQTHPDLLSYPCHFCCTVFTGARARTLHLVSNTACLDAYLSVSFWAIPCGSCANLFPDKKLFLRHLFTSSACHKLHKEPCSVVFCPTCSKPFGSLVECCNHLLWSVPCAVSYPCIGCRKIFPSVKARTQHLISSAVCRSQHILKPCPLYQCGTCKVSYVSASSLHQHACAGENLLPSVVSPLEVESTSSTAARASSTPDIIIIEADEPEEAMSTASLPSTAAGAGANTLPLNPITDSVIHQHRSVFPPSSTTTDVSTINTNNTTTAHPDKSCVTTPNSNLPDLTACASSVDVADSAACTDVEKLTVFPSWEVFSDAVASLSLPVESMIVDSSDTTAATNFQFDSRLIPHYARHCVLCHSDFDSRNMLNHHLKCFLPCRMAFFTRCQPKYPCFCCKRTFARLYWRKKHLDSTPAHQPIHRMLSSLRLTRVARPGQNIEYCEVCCTTFLSPKGYYCITCQAVYPSMHALCEHRNVSPACQGFIKVEAVGLAELDWDERYQKE